MNSSIFKRIMVASESSESANEAVATATGLARLNKAKLYSCLSSVQVLRLIAL